MPDSNDIIIEEYVPERHAASIAEMWNLSSQSWGGDSSYQTEESVIREHEINPLLKLFLAVDRGEVIGYCSFSHYREDTGALYIPLLNVRPDYHGRKVGKRLVRRAVEETIKLGWPRLDLYTWPGNVKAVPTYKKSGFFWEKRDDTTHLMNFIPSVLQTAAVSAYFEKIDWYEDSVRKIEVKPDGHGEGGFDYFTYEWLKDGMPLRMEYERTGRGLRLIETEDYRIQVTIPGTHERPFGAEYPVVYEAVNKSGKPLLLQVTGISNPQIRHELEESLEVESEARIEGSFFIHPVEEEQNIYQTHPVVEAELLINGLSAVFKLGVKPKYPVKLKLQLPERAVFKGEKVELDVTVENKYTDGAVFVFELPGDSILAFAQNRITVEVPAGSRRTVKVQATLLAHGIWHHNVGIRRLEESGEAFVLEQELSLVLPGADAAFGGKTDEGWIICSGRYAAVLDKSSHKLYLREGHKTAVTLPYPKFGRPYTDEFKKFAPLEVKIHREQEAIRLEAVYDISAREGLRLTMVVTLLNNGLISRHYSIHNSLDTDQEEDLILKDSFQFGLHGGVIPYNGKYVDLSSGEDASDLDYWEGNKFTENWIFAKGETPKGISWPAELELIQESWLHAVEHSLGRIPAGSQAVTRPLRVALGTWDRWQDFRAYALHKGNGAEELRAGQPLEMSLNNGNPFISGQPELILQEQKMSYLDGEVRVSSSKGSIGETRLELNGEEKLTEAALPLARPDQLEPDVLTVHLDMENAELERTFLVLPVQDGAIRQDTLEVSGSRVLAADNGVLRIQASPDFAPGLFSLVYKDQEWLDSSFPQPVAKSWWNPWVGGIVTGVGDVTLRSLMEEQAAADFAELTDDKGNRWSGIRLSVTIQKNEQYRGLILHQYFMLQPGVPVLACTVRVEQNTGKPLYPLNLETSTFYQAGSEVRDGRFYVKNSSGEDIVYKAGGIQAGSKSGNGLLQLGARERKERLTLAVPPEHLSASLMVNADAILTYTEEYLHLQDGEERFSKPQFYLISDLQIPVQAFADLLSVRFRK